MPPLKASVCCNAICCFRRIKQNTCIIDVVYEQQKQGSVWRLYRRSPKVSLSMWFTSDVCQSAMTVSFDRDKLKWSSLHWVARAEGATIRRRHANSKCGSRAQERRHNEDNGVHLISCFGESSFVFAQSYDCTGTEAFNWFKAVCLLLCFLILSCMCLHLLTVILASFKIHF